MGTPVSYCQGSADYSCAHRGPKPEQVLQQVYKVGIRGGSSFILGQNNTILLAKI
jgi:hypothetical protein